MRAAVTLLALLAGAAGCGEPMADRPDVGVSEAMTDPCAFNVRQGLACERPSLCCPGGVKGVEEGESKSLCICSNERWLCRSDAGSGPDTGCACRPLERRPDLLYFSCAP